MRNLMLDQSRQRETSPFSLLQMKMKHRPLTCHSLGREVYHSVGVCYTHKHVSSDTQFQAW